MPVLRIRGEAGLWELVARSRDRFGYVWWTCERPSDGVCLMVRPESLVVVVSA